MANSFDSGQRPLTQNYNAAGSNPYGSGDPYYNQSTGFLPPQKPKSGVSNWIKFGIPAAILIIVAVVVGVVVGTRKNDDSSSSSSSSSDPSAVVSAKSEIGRFAVSTDSEFMVPVYPSTVHEFLFFLHVFSLLRHKSRQTLLPSRLPRSSIQPTPASHGRQIPSSRLTRARRMCAPTGLVSLLPHTSGQRCRTLSRTIPISAAGTRPFLATPLPGRIWIPFLITWMVTAAFSMFVAKSRNASRPFLMFTA